MKYIGVNGCLPELPETFPLETPENSGNMIHANAPFEMYGDKAVFSRSDRWRQMGHAGFLDFVNAECSHLIVTMANTLRDASPDGTRYSNFTGMLNKLRVPLVVFGFGVQAKHNIVADLSFPPEAIEMVRTMSAKSAAFGVRGQFTADALAKHAGVTNTFVTGCPSLFSRPSALAKLRQNWRSRKARVVAYAGTNYNDTTEQQLFQSAIEKDRYLIEPVNRDLYAVSIGQSAALPGGIRKLKMDKKITDHLRRKLRLFRRTSDWYEFNETTIDATFGTRFHVNMASILSGKPALWLTHDSRTRELAEAMDLPSIPLSEMRGRNDVPEMDYSRFFSRLSGHFDNFNRYLTLNGLPTVPTISEDVTGQDKQTLRERARRYLGAILAR